MLITLADDEGGVNEVVELPTVPSVGHTIQIKGAGWTVKNVVWNLEGGNPLIDPPLITVVLIPWRPRNPPTE